MSSFRNAMSVSPFTEPMLAAGIRFGDDHGEAATPAELQRLFIRHGASEVYARINTYRERPGGQHGMSLREAVEDRAALARDLSVPFNPELMLCAPYGDNSGQSTVDLSEYPELDVPGPWAKLDRPTMERILGDYGELVARELLGTGVTVNIWNLGNEVDWGSCGVAVPPMPHVADDRDYAAPDGVDPEIGRTTREQLWSQGGSSALDFARERLWPHVAALFGAVADGIRRVDPDARFSTHIGAVVEPDFAVAFYQAMADGGCPMDEAGFSFYASAGLPLARVRDTVAAVNSDLGIPVFFAEFSYPSGPFGPGGIFAGWDKRPDGYGNTPEGQAEMIRDLVAWGVDNGVSGLRPWAPDLVMGPWQPMSLFAEPIDGTCRALPAIDAVAEAVGAR